MGEFPGRARSAYLGTTDIGTGCTSALTHGLLSTCRSDTPILGSGHVWLYLLDTVPTYPRRALGFAVLGNTHGELSSFIYHGRSTPLCLLS